MVAPMNLALPRFLSILCLSFALALFGAFGVLACPDGGPVSAVVICGGAGAETIYLDAQGQPAPAEGDCASCPVCLTAAAGPLPQHSALPVFAPVERSDGITQFETGVVTAPVFIPAARGPPIQA